MTMNIIATVILAYFIVREHGFVYSSWRTGYAFIWVLAGAAQVSALLVLLYALWA